MDLSYYTETSGQILSILNGEVLYVYSDDIIDTKILNNLLKEPIIKPKFRLYLLNPDETIRKEIPSSDIVFSSSNYTENYQNGQRRSLNVSLINKDGRYNPNINTLWIHDRFRLDIGFENNNKIYWFPKGIYVISSPEVSHGDGNSKVNLSLSDKFSLFEGNAGRLEATYEVLVGSDIKNVILDILTMDSGSGVPVDPKEIIYDPIFEGLKMPYTITKDADGTRADLLNDIATILNAEIFYNNLGNFCVLSINETTNDVNKPVSWFFKDTETEYLNSSVSFSFDEVINEVHVVGDDLENALAYASIYNNNPESPICIQRIGRRIKYVNDENIITEERAKDRAKYELRKYGILGSSINISARFNPLLVVNSLISLDDSFYGYNQDKFLIQSISYSLGANSTTTIGCCNLQNLEITKEEV